MMGGRVKKKATKRLSDEATKGMRAGSSLRQPFVAPSLVASSLASERSSPTLRRSVAQSLRRLPPNICPRPSRDLRYLTDQTRRTNTMPVDDILMDCEMHMEKAIEHLQHEMRGIRTGRASPAIVENIKVDY